MERLTERTTDGVGGYKIQAKNLDYHCVAKDKRGYVTYYGQHIDKLAEYEDLEGRLNGISIDQVVNGFIKAVESQTHEGYENGRILTNAEADKWNKYKQLEEQGLLMQFPVPIGTTVYKFEPSAKGTKRYIKTIVTRYEVFDDSIWFTFANGLGRNITDFGKYVFLTEEEAEQKLKELKS